jgi:hypothetical protein
MDVAWIDSTAALLAFAEGIGGGPLAVDTEADSFHHYREKLCLLQMSVGGRHALVDPLASIDLAVLRRPFEDASVRKILHGADYDVRLLARDFRIVLVGVTDTMIAARLLGEPALGLAALLAKYLDLCLDKAHQRADWSKRPLSDAMRAYAVEEHLGRSYAALTQDTTRIMGRLKALYRSQAITCAGPKVFGSRQREEWLAQLSDSGLQRRARRLYQELDLLQSLRREARQDLILECRKHSEAKLLRTVPWLGPIRVALLIGRVQTPHRFRSKRQFWAYCGLALETRSSADYQMVDGQLTRRKKPAFIRGLNLNHNHDLKNLFKSAATTAGGSHGAFGAFYENLLKQGMRPEMARLTLARKIAAITLHVWKKGEAFDVEYVKPQAA